MPGQIQVKAEVKAEIAMTIKALTEGRREAYKLSWEYDRMACQALDDGDTVKAIVYGVREGEARVCAEMVSAILTKLRLLRREAQ